MRIERRNKYTQTDGKRRNKGWLERQRKYTKYADTHILNIYIGTYIGRWKQETRAVLKRTFNAERQ